VYAAVSDVASGVVVPRVAMQPAPSPEPTRAFLPYLEGMRGFFSLYIAVIHGCFYVLKLHPSLPSLPLVITQLDVVVLFIVISGYVLGLPVARAGQVFRGGLATFAQRRALRILPAYYAALILSIPISLYYHAAEGDPLGFKPLLAAIALHVTMLHDVSNRFIYTLDPPMWSIAIEAQIYVLFPFLLVPLARRFGFRAMVVAGFALGLIPTAAAALHHAFGRYWMSNGCFWFIGEFALGYAAANVCVDTRPGARRFVDRWPWQTLALALMAPVFAAVSTSSPVGALNGNGWLIDILLGLALVCQFTADERARRQGRKTWFERFFLWKPLLVVGTFSYSFYLVHEPIIMLFTTFARPDWSIAATIALVAFSIVVALAAAYGFYFAVERPFLTAYRRRGDAQSLRSARVAEIADPVAGAPGAAPTGD
jgi:peptidoglycan/LPS O-acetylase OafA/YrhL